MDPHALQAPGLDGAEGQLGHDQGDRDPGSASPARRAPTRHATPADEWDRPRPDRRPHPTAADAPSPRPAHHTGHDPALGPPTHHPATKTSAASASQNRGSVLTGRPATVSGKGEPAPTGRWTRRCGAGGQVLPAGPDAAAVGLDSASATVCAPPSRSTTGSAERSTVPSDDRCRHHASRPGRGLPRQRSPPVEPAATRGPPGAAAHPTARIRCPRPRHRGSLGSRRSLDQQLLTARPLSVEQPDAGPAEGRRGRHGRFERGSRKKRTRATDTSPATNFTARRVREEVDGKAPAPRAPRPRPTSL